MLHTHTICIGKTTRRFDGWSILQNNLARIKFIPGLISSQKLKDTLYYIGYELVIDESDEAKDQLEAPQSKTI